MKLKRHKSVSILIPVYNEEKTVEKLLLSVIKLKTRGLKKEIIVVDDASTDKSAKIIRTISKKYKIKTFRHKKTLGKGASFRTGLLHSKGEIIVIQDADLEYPASNILEIIKPIVDGNSLVVFGSRKLRKEKYYSSYPYYIGGAIIDIIIKKVLNTNITDAICGPKAFDRKVLTKIGKIESKGFEIDTELTAKIIKLGISIKEVPIIYKPRTIKEGKKIRWYDSIGIIKMLIMLKLFRK